MASKFYARFMTYSGGKRKNPRGLRFQKVNILPLGFDDAPPPTLWCSDVWLEDTDVSQHKKHGICGVPTGNLLTYGQANWKNHHPKNFFGPDSTEKYEVAFGCLPSLKVKAAEGEGEILLAEGFNIDLFLAKKFGLLGENEYEEATIRAFYSQIHYLRERSLMRMTWTFPDKRRESWETFVKTTLPDFIRKHEQHLERNGSNGHYFGDKFSLADIHLMSVIDHFLELPRGEELVDLFKASTPLWKVIENAREGNPLIAAWRNTDEFKKCVEGGKVLYSTTAFDENEQRD